MKEVRQAVALYLRNPGNHNEFLAVRRPADARSLPNVWGLPAVTLVEGETLYNAIKRVGTEKLNTEVEPTNFIGVKAADRDNHTLVLMDFAAELVGREPDVTEAETESTKYGDQIWTPHVALLTQAAKEGSLCSQIILDQHQIPYNL